MENKGIMEVQHFTDSPEIQSFHEVKQSKNDDAYGVTWGNVVREYLKTAYSGESEQAEVVLNDVTYKILKRDSVTSFYNADGNTLFDVENSRLAKEYEFVTKEATGKESVSDETMEEALPEEDEGNALSVPKDISENAGAPIEDGDNPAKERAKAKLQAELKSAKEKGFAKPIINYLLKRCDEDSGLAEDVAQKHKTLEKCFSYIYAKAKGRAKGKCAAVSDDVVYEWAEDYYHKDDKVEEEKKAKKSTERVKQHKANEKKQKERIECMEKATEIKKQEEPKLKKNSKDMEGQMDLFSLMGM